VAEQLFAAGAPSAIGNKSEPAPRQLPVGISTSALNDKSEPGARQLPVEEGTSALNDKSKPEPRQLLVEDKKNFQCIHPARGERL
jgi:hypothetical protein